MKATRMINVNKNTLKILGGGFFANKSESSKSKPYGRIHIIFIKKFNTESS